LSPALPVVSGRQVCAALARGGFEQVSTRGSHVKLRHPDGRMVIVPLHDTLARGTLASVLRQANLSSTDLVSLLR